MIDFKHRKWLEFKIEDVFIINTGAHISTRNLKKGDTPRISASGNNNGIIGYFFHPDNPNYRVQRNFISVSFLGSVFYHPYRASLDMKIHALRLKHIELNKNLAHFLIFFIERMASIYSYGNQLSSSDLPRKKIILPVGVDNQPDFSYMEVCMKMLEEQKKKEYFSYITKRFETLKGIKEPLPLKEKKWKAFYIEDVADIVSGKDIYEAERIVGTTPYISSSANNNGIGYFVENDNATLENGCLSVNRNGSVGYSFYHPYNALYSNDCRKLRPKYKSRYVGLFLSNQITQQKDKYGYGYKMGTARLKKQKIMLPINTVEQPDYEYMEQYMKYVEYRKINKYLIQYGK